MNRLPGAVFIIDPKKEEIALREARKLHIPVIAFLDTNCDPDEVDYPIPGNDDALRSIAIICNTITSNVMEGINERDHGQPKKEKGQAQDATKKKAEGVRKKSPVRKQKTSEEQDKQAVDETKTEENNVSVS